MYLVNVRTLELEEFIGKAVPPYAILSHRWGSDELTFEEVRKNRIDKHKAGAIKMMDACRVAQQSFGLDYLWIDTCCIDKKSSAELSEAINSMFRWYQNSKVCIAYLNDVGKPLAIGGNIVPFEDSKWFSRAWTLQELLAPQNVHFYDFEWNLLGDKPQLIQPLVTATNIPQEALTGEKKLADFMIANKMYWASSREATREEDIAYSLIGLFDVNMPLLYGEGKQAFMRLQEELIKQCSDYTFLFWGLGNDCTRLFANSPADFASYSANDVSHVSELKAVSLSNLGLEISLKLVRWDWKTYALKYWDQRGREHQFMVLFRLDPRTGFLHRSGHIKADLRHEIRPEFNRRSTRVTIMKDSPFNDDPRSLQNKDYCGFMVDSSDEPSSITPIHNVGLQFVKDGVWIQHGLFGQRTCQLDPRTLNSVGRFRWLIDRTFELYLLFCFDFDFNPVIHIKTREAHESRYLVTDGSCYINNSIMHFLDKLSWKPHYSGIERADFTLPFPSYEPAATLCRLDLNAEYMRRLDEFRIPIPNWLGSKELDKTRLRLCLLRPWHIEYQYRSPCWTIKLECFH